MAKNSNQSLWMGISFLVVGLALGMVINTNGATLLTQLTGKETDTKTTTQAQTDAQVADTVDPSRLESVAVSVDDDAVLGDANAPVTIVEFSDFQCPYCEHFYTDSFSQLKEEYIDTGIVKLVYRDFPLPMHQDASMAAQAAECVRRADGKMDDAAYFEMHDLLFENQSAWSNNADAQAIVAALAKDNLGVDISACLSLEVMKSEVEADYTAGRGYGISGTPTFFIDGKKIVGAYPYLVFQKIINFVQP
jgi:protein-disulfide isomerase